MYMYLLIFVTGDFIHFEIQWIICLVESYTGELETGHMSWCHDDVYKLVQGACAHLPPPAPLFGLCHYHCHQCQWHHCEELWSLSSIQQTNKHKQTCTIFKTLFWLRALSCSSGPLALHWPGLGHYYNQITPAQPDVISARPGNNGGWPRDTFLCDRGSFETQHIIITFLLQDRIALLTQKSGSATVAPD